MSELLRKRCVPCKVGMAPLSRAEAETLLRETPAWHLAERGEAIEREFKFKNFRDAIAFVNRVAEIAEKEGHHPDTYIFYNRVKLSHSTHAIGGLSENDFILASKIDTIV